MIKGKYKRIVAYGCSFTAGDELPDAEVLGMREEDVDSLKRSGITRAELYGRKHADAVRAGKNLTWVRWLADKYQVPYSNRSVGGGSIEQMIFRIERDYRIGKVSDDDLVLVGLTSMYRWFQFDNNGAEHSWVFSYSLDKTSEMNDALVKYYVNDYNIIWRYYSLLNYLQMLSEKHSNIKMVHAISPFSCEKEFIVDNNKLDVNFKKMIDSFEITNIINKNWGMGDLYSHIPKEESTHGWGHPKIKYQKEFANLLYHLIEAEDD